MLRYRAWLALPVIAGLFIAYPTAARAAAGDTVQTTGGGWIVPSVPVTSTAAGPVRTATTNNMKATFGFVASATYQADGTLGDFQGELSYNDHGFGLKLHSVSVTSVSVDSVKHTATFSGMADVDAPSNSGPHSFTVSVYDGGEPSTNDTFDIAIPDLAYERSGLLGGGNIQVRP